MPRKSCYFSPREHFFYCVSSTFSPFFVSFNCISLEMIDPSYSLPQISSFRNLQVVENGIVIEIIQRQFFVMVLSFHFHLIQPDNWFFVVKFVAFHGNLLERFNRVCTDCVNQSITFNLMRHKRTLSHDAVIDYNWMQTTALQVSSLGRTASATCFTRTFCMTIASSQGFIYLNYLSV